MAQSLRRPSLSAVGFQSSIHIQQRLFRVMPSRLAASQTGPIPRQPASPSLRLHAKERGVIPSDIGVLPYTFVAPSGANRPSLIKTPRRTVRFQWARLLQHTRDFLALLYYKYSAKPRPALQLRRTVPAAEGLHRQMYTALAESDAATLQKICADGLRESLAARIHRRGRERWTWELLRYTKRSRVMSHKGVPLGTDDLAIRQAIVRISSRQRLTRYNPDGTVVSGTGEERDVQEYLVIQRRMFAGKEEDWQVWGTTEETTLAKLEEQHEAGL